jgi:hypothetical protein
MYSPRCSKDILFPSLCQFGTEILRGLERTSHSCERNIRLWAKPESKMSECCRNSIEVNIVERPFQFYLNFFKSCHCSSVPCWRVCMRGSVCDIMNGGSIYHFCKLTRFMCGCKDMHDSTILPNTVLPSIESYLTHTAPALRGCSSNESSDLNHIPSAQRDLFVTGCVSGVW